MKWKDYIDENEVKTAISTLQAPDKVFEVRVIGTTKKDILSGYFRDADTLLEALDTIDVRRRNIYFTLGELKDECFARAQSECFLKSPQTSSDSEVVRYRWLFIDLDPVRTAGVSSNEQELAAAWQTAENVRNYLRGLGFESPVLALSGNGYHLLYRIDVLNDAEGRDIVERCLKALALKFDSEQVKVDTTNSNPSRICKLHGTLAQKGRSTKERPHRMSKLLYVPEPIKTTDITLLKALAAEDPEAQPQQTTASNTKQEFDLIKFMMDNGMTYEESSNTRAKIYRLDECPFDHNHRNGDAKIFQYPNGAIAFKCQHNSCKDYKWQDVRKKFEPDAYEPKEHADDERIDKGYHQHVETVAIESLQEAPKKKPKPKKMQKLSSGEALLAKKLPPIKVYVGIDDAVPFLVEGTCILSAKPKLGKSWLALCMCLAIANGDDFLGYKTRQCSTLYIDLETAEVIQQTRLKQALKGAPVPSNFYIAHKTYKIGDGFTDQIEAYLAEDPNIGVVVVDMFEGIRTDPKNQRESEYTHAYRDIEPLNDLANKYHISIILVHHNKKSIDPDDKFSGILGSTALQGAVAQMIVITRRGETGPRTISVRGRAIDGDVVIKANLDKHEWTLVDGASDAEAERQKALEQYRTSEIRQAVIRVLAETGEWKGRASDLITASADYDFGLTWPVKEIGGFLTRNIGLFMSEDQIRVKRMSNGTGGAHYNIQKVPLVTVGNPVGEAETHCNC